MSHPNRLCLHLESFTSCFSTSSDNTPCAFGEDIANRNQDPLKRNSAGGTVWLSGRLLPCLTFHTSERRRPCSTQAPPAYTHKASCATTVIDTRVASSDNRAQTQPEPHASFGHTWAPHKGQSWHEDPRTMSLTSCRVGSGRRQRSGGVWYIGSFLLCSFSCCFLHFSEFVVAFVSLLLLLLHLFRPSSPKRRPVNPLGRRASRGARTRVHSPRHDGVMRDRESPWWWSPLMVVWRTEGWSSTGAECCEPGQGRCGAAVKAPRQRRGHNRWSSSVASLISSVHSCPFYLSVDGNAVGVFKMGDDLWEVGGRGKVVVEGDGYPRWKRFFFFWDVGTVPEKIWLRSDWTKVVFLSSSSPSPWLGGVALSSSSWVLPSSASFGCCFLLLLLTGCCLTPPPLSAAFSSSSFRGAAVLRLLWVLLSPPPPYGVLPSSGWCCVPSLCMEKGHQI